MGVFNNPMHEILLNLHMHTRYSDGYASHRDIARVALKSGLDAVIVTDHNVLVGGMEGYYRGQKRQVLLLVGEEIHDQAREPQKNHLLALGAVRELATYAHDSQLLINQVRASGGLSFIAHPDDPAALAFNETDISWVDWSVTNFTGLELWNGLSELKTLVPSRMHGLLYAFFPALVAHHPLQATLNKWGGLLDGGRRVVAIGGSDAHAAPMRLGPLRRIIYPYEFHFRAINTHVILPAPFRGDAETDKRSLYTALAQGRCFIGYDLPAPTRGFRFTAQGRDSNALMGEEISAAGGVTLQAILPAPAQVRLFKGSKGIHTWKHHQAITHIAAEPGAYRIEAWRNYLGKKRGWIFSNPIYVVK